MRLLHSMAEPSLRGPNHALLDGCFDAQRAAAVRPSSDQRDGSGGLPSGSLLRALRGGAPQGTRNFDERSDAEVYGATPSTAAKETTTLPKVHWGGGWSRGSRSPSGEPPEAPTGDAPKADHLSGVVEGSEA